MTQAISTANRLNTDTSTRGSTKSFGNFYAKRLNSTITNKDFTVKRVVGNTKKQSIPLCLKFTINILLYMTCCFLAIMQQKYCTPSSLFDPAIPICSIARLNLLYLLTIINTYSLIYFQPKKIRTLYLFTLDEILTNVNLAISYPLSLKL